MKRKRNAFAMAECIVAVAFFIIFGATIIGLMVYDINLDLNNKRIDQNMDYMACLAEKIDYTANKEAFYIDGKYLNFDNLSEKGVEELMQEGKPSGGFYARIISDSNNVKILINQEVEGGREEYEYTKKR